MIFRKTFYKTLRVNLVVSSISMISNFFECVCLRELGCDSNNRVTDMYDISYSYILFSFTAINLIFCLLDHVTEQIS